MRQPDKTTNQGEFNTAQISKRFWLKKNVKNKHQSQRFHGNKNEFQRCFQQKFAVDFARKNLIKYGMPSIDQVHNRHGHYIQSPCHGLYVAPYIAPKKNRGKLIKTSTGPSNKKPWAETKKCQGAMDKSLARSNMNSAPHPPRCWLGRWAAADSGMFGDFWKDPVLEKPPPSRPWFRIRSFSIGRLERKKMGRFQFLFFLAERWK